MTPYTPSKTIARQLRLNKNEQNTTNKRRSSLAKLRRSSEGYSLPSSGLNVDKQPKDWQAWEVDGRVHKAS